MGEARIQGQVAEVLVVELESEIVKGIHKAVPDLVTMSSKSLNAGRL